MIIMVTVKATVMLNSQRAQWGQGREKKEILQILKKWAFVHWSCSGAGSGIVSCHCLTRLQASHWLRPQGHATARCHFSKHPVTTSASRLYWGQILVLTRAAPAGQRNSWCPSAGSIPRNISAPWLPEAEICDPLAPQTSVHSALSASPQLCPMCRQRGVQELCKLIAGEWLSLCEWVSLQA